MIICLHVNEMYFFLVKGRVYSHSINNSLTIMFTLTSENIMHVLKKIADCANYSPTLRITSRKTSVSTRDINI